MRYTAMTLSTALHSSSGQSCSGRAPTSSGRPAGGATACARAGRAHNGRYGSPGHGEEPTPSRGRHMSRALALAWQLMSSKPRAGPPPNRSTGMRSSTVTQRQPSRIHSFTRYRPEGLHVRGEPPMRIDGDAVSQRAATWPPAGGPPCGGMLLLVPPLARPASPAAMRAAAALAWGACGYMRTCALPGRPFPLCCPRRAPTGSRRASSGAAGRAGRHASWAGGGAGGRHLLSRCAPRPGHATTGTDPCLHAATCMAFAGGAGQGSAPPPP